MTVGIRLMGEIAAQRCGREIALAGEKQRLVLAALAMSPGASVPTERIVDLVWGDAGPPSARRTVQSHVAALRSHIGLDETLVRRGPGYVLNVDRQDVDLLRFEDAVTTALGRADVDPASTARRLAELLSEWAEPLAGTAVSDRFRSVLAPFEELHIQASEAIVVAQIDSGEAGVAVRTLEALVRRHPTREHMWLQLARALDATGRRRDALHAVQRAREALRDQLGIEPGSALEALELRLLDGDGRGAATAPAGSSIERRPRVRSGQLPVLRSELIGRSADLEDLRGLLGQHALVTLTGTGGIGKTRLALELARRMGHDFDDGTVLVELAAVGTSESVPAVVAASIGAVHPDLDPLDAIAAHLGRAQLLIVLDNCEHVLDAAADVVKRIIAACPRVQILATSREPIAVDGEQLWHVPPLDPRSFGVQLFCQRAGEADSTFRVTEPELETIASICERLDGIPLAVELAAAHTRSMGVLDLADRLEDRFQLLRRGTRHQIDRHRTLFDTIDWSYRLLDDTAQRLFAVLSVFAGGFDLVAAERIGRLVEANRDVAVTLTDLVDKSMIEFDRHAGRGRYRILETLRQFGATRLDALSERDAVHDLHMEHYVEVAEDSHSRFTGEDWDGGRALVTLEWANLRASLDRAVATRRLAVGERLIVATTQQSSILVRHEHAQWTDDVLALTTALESTLNPAVAGCGAWWLHSRGRLDEARDLASAGIAAAPSPVHASTDRCWLALCLIDQDLEELDRMLENWDTASAASADRFARYRFAWCLAFCSIRSLTQHGEYHDRWCARGVALLEQAASVTSNPAPHIWLSHARGIAALLSGDRPRALECYERTIELSRSAGHYVMEATTAMFMAGALAAGRGPIDPDAYALVIDVTHRHRVYGEITIGYLVIHLLFNGYRELAATLHGFVSASGALPPGVRWPDIGDDPDLLAWSATGAAMSYDEAVDYALAHLAEPPTP